MTFAGHDGVHRAPHEQCGPSNPATLRSSAESGTDGHRLGELRNRAGVTQMELAKLMGIGQPRVSAIERGDIDTLTVASLRAYVEGLGGAIRVTAQLNGGELRLRLPPSD